MSLKMRVHAGVWTMYYTASYIRVEFNPHWKMDTVSPFCQSITTHTARVSLNRGLFDCYELIENQLAPNSASCPRL